MPTAIRNMSLSVEAAKFRQIWRSADGVCFDVDSTVCMDEGLDELAEFCGVGPQVAEWQVNTLKHFAIAL